MPWVFTGSPPRPAWPRRPCTSSSGRRTSWSRPACRRRAEQWRASVADPVLALSGSARRVGAVFERLGKTFAAPGYRGCPFINAAAEYPGPDGPVAAAIAAHRAQVRGLFAELLAGVRPPPGGPHRPQLVLLYDGTMVGAQLDQGPRAAAGRGQRRGNCWRALHLPGDDRIDSPSRRKDCPMTNASASGELTRQLTEYAAQMPAPVALRLAAAFAEVTLRRRTGPGRRRPRTRFHLAQRDRRAGPARGAAGPGPGRAVVLPRRVVPVLCNLELRALQAALPRFQARGASLIAISPQSPTTACRSPRRRACPSTYSATSASRSLPPTGSSSPFPPTSRTCT